MKNLSLFLPSIALLSGCVSRTEYGECVGLDPVEKHPDLIYKLSAQNLILGVIFVQTIVVPVFVAIDQLYCPVGKKNEKTEVLKAK